MGILFELVVNLVESVLVVSFLGQYNGYKFEGRKRIILFMLAVVISFGCVTISDSITHFSEFSIIPDFIIYMVYCYFALDGSLSDQFMSSILAILGLIFTSTFSIFLFSIITGASILELVSVTDWLRVIFVVTTKILLYIFLTCIDIFYRSLKSNYVPKSVRFSMLMVPVVTFVIMSLIMNMALMVPITTKIKVYAVLSSIGLFAIDVFVLMLFNGLSNAYKEKMSIEIKNMEDKNAEDMMVIYEDLRIIKHNIKNDVTVISELIRVEKYERALSVLQDLYKGVDEIRKFVMTGNDALDALINSKIGEAHEQGIKVIHTIEKNVLNGMGEHDIINLMGNLLDNAIEACVKNESDKIIEVYIEEKKEVVIITVKNTVDTPVLIDNLKMKTTKSDKKNHGLGMKSIEKIAGKYGGYVNKYDGGNMFCISIIMDKMKK